MRCFTDDQLERIAVTPSVSIPRRQWEHIKTCGGCRSRIEQARADAGLVADILELRRTRQEVATLAQRLSSDPPD